MANKIQIRPEVARLAQHKAKATGALLAKELARSVLEEAILDLDPELNLIIEPNASISAIDSLVSSVGVNDIVVNGRNIDVRYLDADDNVSISSALIGTPYLSCGSFVVALNGTVSGAVVGYVSQETWLSCEEQFDKEDIVSFKMKTQSNFNFVRTLCELLSKSEATSLMKSKSIPDEMEIKKFIEDRSQYIAARQKQIVTAIMCDSAVRDMVARVRTPVITSLLSRVLADSAIWANRVEGLVTRLSPRFPRLTPEEIRTKVKLTGERFGGQPDAPLFRKAVVETLMREQVARQFHGQSLAKVKSVIEQVFAGRSAVDSVKDFVKNRVAMDLALTIKQERQKVQGFVAATAEEIGFAFQKLALQPTYATHSQDAESGVESINEALELLEAGHLAEQARLLETELAIH